MGLYDKVRPPEDDSDYEDDISSKRKTSSEKLSDDGVTNSTPSGKRASEISDSKRPFFWLFSATFVVIVIVLIIAFMYVLFSDSTKDMGMFDIFTTVLKILANILMGLSGE
jgi:hypothetical protein